MGTFFTTFFKRGPFSILLSFHLYQNLLRGGYIARSLPNRDKMEEEAG
jgi:hypothetical protein